MLDTLKKELHTLRRDPAGERFQRWHDRRHKDGMSIWKVLRWLAAAVLVALGLLMLVAPGPGILVAALGAGLLAQDSVRIARLMDRTEMLGRRLWRRRPAAVR